MTSRDTAHNATALIVGAGPAGLTAARELLDKTSLHPVLCEADAVVGGISRTINHNGNRMDIGGHRFFSKSDRVRQWWQHVMPDMLTRRRVSRILYEQRLYDYPLVPRWRTVANLGPGRTLRAVMGYVKAQCRPLPETSLENFFINRFGRPLYSMFFESYTQKVWGVHPSALEADWGAQRVKGLSVAAIVKDMARRGLGLHHGRVETSLIDRFLYPKHGPGELWERVAAQAINDGAALLTRHTVTQIHIDRQRRVDYVVATDAQGNSTRIDCDCLLSSMPIAHLVAALRGIDVPAGVAQVARELPYRDFITVGLLVERLSLSHDACPTDTWIYIQEKGVRVGRLQIYNNWSPFMVKDNGHTVWVGLEYFCNEGDDLWTLPDEDFVAMAKDEMVKAGVMSARTPVLDSKRVNVAKAYPAYHGTYVQIEEVRRFLDTIGNLWCIGRNGQHRYNNMDHSMLTAMEAVDAIAAGSTDKRRVWNVNAEDDNYHEEC